MGGLWILAILIATSAAAESFTQKLDTQLSTVQFNLETSAIRFRGKLRSFSGTLALDPVAFERSKLALQASTDGATIERSADAPDLSMVLQALFPNQARFTSDSIIAIGKDRYRVVGQVRSDRGIHKVSFPITVRSLSKRQSEIEITAGGTLDQENQENPLQFLTGESHGRINCSLIFKS